jgi:hypothetical protein
MPRPVAVRDAGAACLARGRQWPQGGAGCTAAPARGRKPPPAWNTLERRAGGMGDAPPRRAQRRGNAARHGWCLLRCAGCWTERKPRGCDGKAYRELPGSEWVSRFAKTGHRKPDRAYQRHRSERSVPLAAPADEAFFLRRLLSARHDARQVTADVLRDCNGVQAWACEHPIFRGVAAGIAWASHPQQTDRNSGLEQMTDVKSGNQ